MRRRIFARSAPVMAAQITWPFLAARTAALTSVAPATVTWPNISPVAGLKEANRSPGAGEVRRSADLAAGGDLSRPSTNSVNKARAVSLSASRQPDNAARNHTPSIMAAIMAARFRASSGATSCFRE